MLNNEQLYRYSRHILVPEIGIQGQASILNSKVLIIGAGGLGSPVLQYLAAAGVGTLGVMDADKVDLTNLQRQVIHNTNDIGKLKVDSVKEKILALNPDVLVNTYPFRAEAANIVDILKDYDIVVDCCDNFPTRYLVNDASVLLKKPFVYGGVLRFDGQTAVFKSPEGPCYRCIFAEAPEPDAIPTCQEAGVFNVLPGIIGLIQSAETLKLIMSTGDSLIGSLLLLDATNMEFRKIKINKRLSCAVCGDNPTITNICEENYKMTRCE